MTGAASSLTYTSPPSACSYLPDRIAQIHYELRPDISGDAYMTQLNEGWRRFGPFLFRPECPSCRMCQSLRVPVTSFRPNASQRRVWKKSDGEVTIRVNSPSSSPEKLELFARFHQHGRDAKGWPGNEPDLDLFLANPFPTEEWTYSLGDRLVGVGYVDTLPEGLSAIYFVYDPAEAKRSLGTCNILAMIASAQARNLPYVYLGYYVESCRSLEYKSRFRPNEMFDGERWRGTPR